MTNVQFISLLTTSISSFVLVILAWIHQNQRLSDLRGDTQRQFADLRGDIQHQFADLRGDTQRQFADQRAETNRQFEAVNSRLVVLEGDLKNFYKEVGRLDGRIEEVARKRA